MAFEAIRASGRAEIAVAAASVAEISRLNILHASLLAMCRAVARLPAAPDLVLVDGNQPPALTCPVRCVVGGDGLSPVDRRRFHRGQGAARPGDAAAGCPLRRLRVGGQCGLLHPRSPGGVA